MREKGFTLIELIIVMAIISVLTIGVLSVLNPLEQYKKAQDARKKADLTQIQKALEEFYNDNGHYPSSQGYLIVGLDGNTVIWGSSWTPYMNILPKDPVIGHNYVYYSPTSSNGQSYYLYATLERGTNDSQACKTEGGVCADPDPNVGNMATLCGGACNYGVSSPNVSVE